MSELTLKDFYKDYADWLRDGAPIYSDPTEGFLRSYGLCSNLVFWCGKNKIGFHSYSFSDEMREQFASAGLCASTPFNDIVSFTRKDSTPSMTYGFEAMHEKCHLNEKRRQWVFDHEK